MQSRNMVGQLYLLLYFFYQAELFPDDKTRRPALPCLNILSWSRDMSRDRFLKFW